MPTDDTDKWLIDPEYKARIVATLWYLGAVDDEIPVYAETSSLAVRVAHEGESGRVWFLIGAMAESDFVPVKWATEDMTHVTLVDSSQRIAEYIRLMDESALPDALRDI